MVLAADQESEVARAIQQLERRAHLTVREAVQRQVRLRGHDNNMRRENLTKRT